MKLSDYVFRFLSERGVKHVFMLAGGGAMHLNDSLGRCPGIEYVCTLHEQAAAIAAEAYARVTNNLGVALVTTGPGGTNSVTGVAAAWLDSTPCLFISGQVKRQDMIGNLGLRQRGVQEINIIPIVTPITKYAATIMEPDSVRFHLEKAIHFAKTSRPGPVWLDIPLDVQAAQIDPDNLIGFDFEKEKIRSDPSKLETNVAHALQLMEAAERPVLLAGNGIRLSGAIEEFGKLVDLLGIPVLTTWLGIDLIAENHPLFGGRPGSIAPRGANFALQNADYLLSIGARLDMATVGFSYERFARAARKVIVEIDPNEFRKMGMSIDVAEQGDAGAFIKEMLRQAQSASLPRFQSWVDRCQLWKSRYPVVLPEHRELKDFVSTYVFSEAMSEVLPDDAVVVSMSAGACVEVFLLAFKVKKGQRIFHNRGTGSMGLAVPASIAACLASERRQTVCIEADGGFQMNTQELETIRRLRLPIKIFVLNNQGYASIRASQQRYFGRLTGADTSSGLTLPDTLKVAEAYGLTAARIHDQTHLQGKLREILATDGPFLCEIMSPPDEVRAPCISSKQLPNGSMVSAPLEDLWPFLPRNEFLENMIIPALDIG